MKFRIYENDENEGRIYLGAVDSPENLSKGEAEDTMAAAWADFQEAHPETDSEFIDFLVKRYEFTEIDDDFEEFVIG